MSEKRRAVVLVSGGMNAATMLYDIITFEKAEIVDCMIFQSGTDEDFVMARELVERLGLPFSLWGYESEPIMASGVEDQDKAEDRALLFTTIINYAVTRAEQLKADTIFAGFCEADLPITKPDLTAFCLAAGGRADILLEFDFPFLVNEKWRVFDLARRLNRLAEITRDTASCDIANDEIQHQWGYGCGACPGCVARWNAWDEYLQKLENGDDTQT